MRLNKQDITLRPRFKSEVSESNKTVIQLFEHAKTFQSHIVISITDAHIYLKFQKEKQHFWSPQLHLKIHEVNHETAMVHGVFGPNPTVWTLFISLHFIVASLFIGFGIWAYSNWAQHGTYAIQLGIMFLMIIVWVGLYFAGQIGKDSSKEQMQELYDFMTDILEK